MPTDPSGWWETERAKLVRQRVVALTSDGDRVLDVGCGRGSMLDDERLNSRFVVKVDSFVWDDWHHQPGAHVCAAADALPFRDGSFDLVGSFDVLEHLPDDRGTLAEQRRVVRPSGEVVASVPSGPSLWSAHDEAVGHLRRYTTKTLTTLANAVGLSVECRSHFFSFLWLPARLMRSRPRRTEEPAQGDGVLARATRAVIGLVCSVERHLIGHLRIPIGTSLWLEARVSSVPPS